jgi:hypothetical protein
MSTGIYVYIQLQAPHSGWVPCDCWGPSRHEFASVSEADTHIAEKHPNAKALGATRVEELDGVNCESDIETKL